MVQLYCLAVLDRNQTVQISIIGDRQLGHWLQNDAASARERTIQRIGDVDTGAGTHAADGIIINAEEGRQITNRIDICTQVYKRFPAQAHGRDHNTPPVEFAGHTATVDAGQIIGRGGRHNFGAKGREAHIGIAGQGDG